MGKAKEIVVKVIPASIANDFVKKHHYSGKVAATGQVYFGGFFDNQLMCVAQWGRPINKYLHIKIVKNTKWNEFLELNRLVCLDGTPKNTESRFIKVMLSLIKKNAPQIKWVISFADATQCGDGTIYRASGFSLISIKSSEQIYELPNGNKMHLMGLQGGEYGAMRKKMLKMGYTNAKKFMIDILKGKQIKGYQLKYIYLIDKNCELNVPTMSFDKIDEMGVGMYKGEKITMQQRKVNMDQSV
jgi:hypothetical protein